MVGGKLVCITSTPNLIIIESKKTTISTHHCPTLPILRLIQFSWNYDELLKTNYDLSNQAYASEEGIKYVNPMMVSCNTCLFVDLGNENTFRGIFLLEEYGKW